MNKAELKRDENAHANILFINDVLQFCAYKTPMPMATNLGGTTILNFSCNDNCPLLKVENKIISLYCGCERVQYTLQETKKLTAL